MFRLGITSMVCAALLLGSGCASHSMEPLPGRLASRLIVDNGISVLDGRVLYLNPARQGQTDPLEVPVAGAEVDLLGGDGQPLPAFAPVRTDGRGRFHFDGLTVGEPYFARARLNDASGKARQLYAFVLPEGAFTCVELSLESTIVAQKIAASPDQLPAIKPEAVKELVKSVRKTLSELITPPAPGGPTAPPPGGAGAGPAVAPPPPGPGSVPNAPSSPIWVPGPNGDGGYWWAPRSGGPGGSWWIETPCGGTWWAPRLGGAGGSWWLSSASGSSWVAVGAGGVLTVPSGSCSFDVTRPPAENCGCVCVPGRNGDRHVYWFLPDGDMAGGSWWVVSNLGGSGAWQDAGLGGTGAWGAQNGPAANPGGENVSTHDTYTWITMPGGQGGYYWSPTGGPGGSWWIQDTTTGGGYWWTSSGGAVAGAPPAPSGSCGCHYIQPPGSSVGYWFLPDGNGSGGSWWVTDINQTTGSWWRSPATAGGPAPTTGAPGVGGSGGAWIDVPGGGTDYVWIVTPGGGGTWWAPPPPGSGGAGSWWLSSGGSGGGSWWVSTGAGAGVPPVGPDGSSACGCHWIQPPGSSSGYWYIPVSRRRGTGAWYVYNIYTGQWSWVSASSPSIASGGGAPAPSAAPAGSGTGGLVVPSPGTRTTVVSWITLPGGGGMWWYPWPSGGGASYWNGTTWVTASSNTYGYYWISLPGGGGTWVWPSPEGHGCCCWVPDGNGGGQWVWVYDEVGDATPPPPPTVIVNVYDLGGLIESLTAPTWNPGTATGSAIFDQLSASVPALKTQLEQAIDTILNVNVLMPFAGVNNAPFPRKDDPRYLLIGTVQLHCNLDGLPVTGVAYALNGEEICRTTTAGDTWRAEYDTRQMKDGEYFLTAHELGPNGQGLGKMLAKGYARIRNLDASEDPCADQWSN